MTGLYGLVWSDDPAYMGTQSVVLTEHLTVEPKPRPEPFVPRSSAEMVAFAREAART